MDFTHFTRVGTLRSSGRITFFPSPIGLHKRNAGYPSFHPAVWHSYPYRYPTRVQYCDARGHNVSIWPMIVRFPLLIIQSFKWKTDQSFQIIVQTGTFWNQQRAVILLSLSSPDNSVWNVSLMNLIACSVCQISIKDLYDAGINVLSIAIVFGSWAKVQYHSRCPNNYLKS